MRKRPLRYPNGMIILFAKAPIAGTVKTRLAADVGPETAAQLYRTLLRDTVILCTYSRLAAVELHVATDSQHPFFMTLAKELDISIVPQCDGDLGQRMHTALREAFKNKEFAVLIGSDCPAMSPDYLARAFEKLDAGCDCVIGPAEDGGYVLLGMRRTQPDLFQNMPWSQEHLLDRTRSVLTSINYSYEELDTLWDVDDLQDLRRWETMIHTRDLRSDNLEMEVRP